MFYSGAHMRVVKYAFVDGGYLLEVYTKRVKHLFGVDGDLDYTHLKQSLGAHKAFYYDCIDDQQEGESQTEYDQRVALKKQQFEKIRRIDGFHVRPGSLRGVNGKRRQKEVDVLLAVDAMNFAFNEAMENAVFIAGDLDFRPLIESLVLHGTFVEIYADPSEGASKELFDAADAQRAITSNMISGWSTESFQKAHRIPNSWRGEFPKEYNKTLKQGTFNDIPCVLAQRSDNGEFGVIIDEGKEKLGISHKDQTILEKYIKTDWGELKWS